MSEIIQLYKDKNKTIKVYPKTLASEVYLDEENNIINNFNEINEYLDAKASKDEVDIERRRIDTFTSLSQGSTTGDAELIDGRIGVDNKKYSNIGGAIRGQITDVKNEIDNVSNAIPYLKSVIKEVNILDTAILHEKALYNDGAVGDKTSAVSNIVYDNTYGFCYEPIRVRDDNGNLLYNNLKSSKTINQSVPVAFYFSKSGSYVKTIYGSGLYKLNGVFDIPDNVYFIAIQQWYQTVANPIDYKVTYDVKSKAWVENDTSEGLVYHVGSGEYNGITHFNGVIECFNYVKNIDGLKTIHIYDGTYDVLAELGGMTYINSKNTTDHTWQEVQPVLSDVRIIGHGNVKLNFLLDVTNYSHYWLFSCLNLRGNHYIENIEIHSANCRYSIHDESEYSYPNTTHEYVNVRAYHNEALIGQGQAYGSGYSINSIGIFKDCYFTGMYDSWTTHANEGCKFFFYNTIIKSLKGDSKCALRISQNGQAKLYSKISNCFIGNGLAVSNEWTDGTVKNDTEIELLNTKIPYLDNRYTNSTILSPIISYNTITGEVTTLLNKTT